MPIVVVLLAAIAGVYFWSNRARAAKNAAHDLADLVGDAASAVRRYQYRRKANQHPADSIEDPKIAAAALMYLAAHEDGAVTQSEEVAIVKQLQSGYGVFTDEARELLALGRWMAEQSHNPDEMVRRLVRKFVQLGSGDDVAVLSALLAEVGAAGDPAGAEDIITRFARALR